MTPMRTCAICRAKKPKSELYRFVVKDGSLVFDEKQQMAGRGVSMCSEECWETARAKKRKVKIDSKSPKGKYMALPDVSWQHIIGSS